MKNILTICQQPKDPDYFEQPSYQQLLDSLDYEILLQVDDQDYQGDSRLILRDGNRYGLLIFGWGSCSGCDALAGCSSISEVEDLRQTLNNQIQWFDTYTDLHIFLRDRDWETQYSWHAEETKDFVDKALKLTSQIES